MIDPRQFLHFVVGELVLHHGPKMVQIIDTVGGERDWYLAALRRPFYAHDRGMNVQSPRDFNDYRVFDVYGVNLGPIPIRARRRTNRAIADWHIPCSLTN